MTRLAIALYLAAALVVGGLIGAAAMKGGTSATASQTPEAGYNACILKHMAGQRMEMLPFARHLCDPDRK